MAYADEDGFGLSDTIDEWANVGDETVRDAVKDTDFTDNPINTSGDEINEVSENAFGTLKEGKDFFFSFHDLIESIVFALSPTGLDPTLVMLVSAGMALMIFVSFTKNAWKHMMLFGMILGAFITIVLVLGTNPEF